MRTSDTLAELAAALAKAQAKLRHAPKDSTGQVGQQKTRYADLATVIDTARPVLAAHGLAIVQGVSGGCDGRVEVSTRLVHRSGEWIEDTLTMPTGQGTAQAVGSAITYARRYALLAMVGIAADDDDGHAATVQPAAKPVKRAPSPRPKPTPAEQVFDRLKMLDDDGRGSVKALAGQAGQSLSVSALADDGWRAQVVELLDALGAG